MNESEKRIIYEYVRREYVRRKKDMYEPKLELEEMLEGV